MILGVDPLLVGDIDFTVIAIVLAKAAITLGICLVATMLMIWFERKIISDLQARIGPNRAGPVRHPPDARRRPEGAAQGRSGPRQGRSPRLPPGAHPHHGPGVHHLQLDPARRRLQQRQRRRGHDVRA
jgi:hypothetical protein